MKKYLFLTLLLVPGVTHAQTLLSLLQNTIIFMDSVVVPFLFGIAFLMFVINVFRFFILEGSNEDGRKKAKDLAIYSVAAFVFLIIFWGIVKIFVDSSGIKGQTQPCPDYIQKSDPTKCP